MGEESTIISCAVTGSVHTPSMSEFLPTTPDQIRDDAVAAADAGAAILHLHARDPADGRPSSLPAHFGAFLPGIADETDAVVNITTGGSAAMSLEDRLAAALTIAPELCSLNLGSMNFGLFPALAARSAWKHDWEEPFLEGSRAWIFRNTFADIEAIIERLGSLGTRFEFECYDVGHLYTLQHLANRRLVEPPLFIQFVVGILGGIGPDVDNVLFLKRTADRLFGDGYSFSVAAAGRHQMRLCTVAALLGGNVRVGLEDSLHLERGRLARSSAEQVGRIREILERLSLTVATPADARARLHLKGAQHVRFGAG